MFIYDKYIADQHRCFRLYLFHYGTQNNQLELVTHKSFYS